MPELPEVEIVCRNLSGMIKPMAKIKKWTFFRSDLRFRIPQARLLNITGLPLQKIGRRAKYILFYFDDYIMISHLGMTGSWRREPSNWKPKKHDHMAFEISDKEVFVFEDPRRFGFIEVIRNSEFESRFSHIGAEPLDTGTDFGKLFEKFRRLNSPVKTALMNQKLLVGVGNIYASEVLFRTGISPLKTCSKIKAQSWAAIFSEIKVVLNEAISAGGSSVSSYRNSYGKEGSYQQSLFVYGRKAQPCLKCQTKIRSVVQAGRSTFWCPKCQK